MRARLAGAAPGRADLLRAATLARSEEDVVAGLVEVDHGMKTIVRGHKTVQFPATAYALIRVASDRAGAAGRALAARDLGEPTQRVIAEALRALEGLTAALRGDGGDDLTPPPAAAANGGSASLDYATKAGRGVAIDLMRALASAVAADSRLAEQQAAKADWAELARQQALVVVGMRALLAEDGLLPRRGGALEERAQLALDRLRGNGKNGRR